VPFGFRVCTVAVAMVKFYIVGVAPTTAAPVPTLGMNARLKMLLNSNRIFRVTDVDAPHGSALERLGCLIGGEGVRTVACLQRFRSVGPEFRPELKHMLVSHPRNAR
jgi:hypothetical protein